MQPIDVSKLSAEIKKTETELNKEISSKLASAIADKQRLAIGLLLKQTLKIMPESGLLSVNTQKAVLSAKNILPGEFTQFYIQNRVQQHKLTETLANQQLKPAPLTLETTRQWFAGQIIQSVVYQSTQNGFAALLVSQSGQFDPKVLAQLPNLATVQSSPPTMPVPAPGASPVPPPGIAPAQMPVSTPIQMPNSVPVQVPGSVPVQVPGTIPIQTAPAQTANLSPAQIPAQTSLQSPLSQQVQLSLESSRVNHLISNEIIKHSQVVKIKTEQPLQVGQQLLLQINKNAGEVSFQLNHSPRESHLVSQYINQLTVKQQALPQLLASLKEITTQTHQANTYFTPQFIKQVDKLLQQFPQMPQLTTASEVKSTVQNSGQFLENKLLNSAMSNPTPSAELKNTPAQLTDLKAGLSQLVELINKDKAVLIPKQLSESSLYKTVSHETITNAQTGLSPVFEPPGRVIHAQVQPPVPDTNLFQLNNHLLIQNRILDQLEGVLSRIMVNQLHSREGGEQQVLNLEIPFRHNDQQEILQLKIREQYKAAEAEKGNKIWTVNMAFHLPSLGGIRIYITLDKNDLAIQFWTEQKNSQQLFQQNFHNLSERLSEAGFTLSQLSAFHGMPEAARKEQKNNQFIIDERV